MKKYNIALLVLVVALAIAGPASAQSSTANTTLQVGVTAEASISIPASSYTFTQTGTVFNNYALTMPFTYKVRTTKVGGSGTVVASFASDFAGNGPKIASSNLTYTSATAGVGSGNASAVTALVGTATNVLTFGANNRSVQAGDAGTVAWTLVNDPQYETGTYTTVVVLTITAL